MSTSFVFVEDIGINGKKEFTDMSDKPIRWMFKLYPWEFMLREEYAKYLPANAINWLEPMWKSVLSNKALLPMLVAQVQGAPEPTTRLFCR